MKHLHAINKIPGVGPQKMKMLLSFFGEPEKIWNAKLEELVASKVGEKLAERIILERNSINPDAEWERLERENIKIITLNCLDYPCLLKESHNPPYILYYQGDSKLMTMPMIAIVGSRKYTAYGAQVAQTFARDLVSSGFIVVSGMAMGIDTFAHRGALDQKGKTIAVLGNSLDAENIYPQVNFNLSREIIGNGLLLSEYPPETKAGPLTFPARNRIVAGMTLGTIVVEAGEKSGALITARMALENNREVFSVPGSIYSPQSIGTHSLIKQGAKLVASVKDILEELNLEETSSENAKTEKIPETESEKILLKILSTDPLHIDNITKLAKLNTSACSGALAMMEIKGWVKNIGGQNYIIT